MPIQDQTIQWPFFAVDLFSEMGMTPPTDYEDSTNDLNNGFLDDNTPQMSINDNLATLINLGFNDEDKNKEILSKFNNDIDEAVNYFLDNASNDATASNQPSTSTATYTSISSLPQSVSSTSEVSMPSSHSKKESRKSIITIDLIDDKSGHSDDEIIALNDTSVTVCKLESETNLPDDIAESALEYDAEDVQTEMEDCPICCNDFESYKTSPSLWEQLKCSHKLCKACYSQILTTRSTMSGLQHTFVKCPFCQGTTG